MTKKFLTSYPSFCNFFIACLLLGLVSRISFYFHSVNTAFESAKYRLMAFSFGLISDLVTYSLLSLFLFAIYRLLYRCAPTQLLKNKINLLLQFVLFIFFTLLVVLNVINQKLFGLLFTGINITLLKSAYHQGISTFNLIAFTNTVDWVLICIVVLGYLGIQTFSTNIAKNLILYIISPIYIFFILTGANYFIASGINQTNSRFNVMFSNPLYNITLSFIESLNAYNQVKFVMDPKQLLTAQFLDKNFLDLTKNQPIVTLSEEEKKQPWNIIVFVLESVGTNYLFNDTQPYPTPMPFLKSLAKNGLWFQNNYSGGNISALGQFSILTGLYPNPTPCHFEMQSNFNIPSMANWLNKPYDSFLVSASNDLYFSMGLNKTFKQYSNAETISPKHEKLFFNMFLDETKSFKFFLNRLNKATTPYLAMYWSTAAHFPYKDYSQHAKIVSSTLSPFERYLNSLRLLDNEIKMVYEHLLKTKQLENTIFIIVGDHGEMFGEHINNWVHGSTLYEEEIKVPLIISAKKLFKPAIIEQVTSSTSILPTILAALHIPYGNQLQGQSLLSSAVSNKYVFVYGDHDELAAIDQSRHKMQISFANNTCKTFDLNKDPHEQNPLACMDAPQKEAILKFRNFQPKILEQINKKYSRLPQGAKIR